ncbi:MAG: hypothetical protein UT39_C0002G0071 [Candidatus Woesebacteria bacterium GW2011_GWA1_39_21]|uniref:Phosphoglycerate mutase n=1 Tax=Candidatus Woesebacteria bacterium GW2011_GWA1_39_21 TaxID=1618550 RepID=A0A0G0QNC2_9BACT|nr:MAG: hypothetical protein UT39_C0002G0071 [Candidatus Woesebacteria bacterium GW2011_GWA1_39_21]
MIYYIFRHGETYFSKNNLHYGEHYQDAEILPEAVPVIEKLAEYLKNKISEDNYTSPFKRAVQTVEIVERITGKKFIYNERIKEEGLSRAEESLEQLEKRLSDFIKDVESKNAKSVAVCSHGWPIAALLGLLNKGYITKMDLAKYPECGQLITVENKTIKTLDFNQGG